VYITKDAGITPDTGMHTETSLFSSIAVSAAVCRLCDNKSREYIIIVLPTSATSTMHCPLFHPLTVCSWVPISSTQLYMKQNYREQHTRYSRKSRSVAEATIAYSSSHSRQSCLEVFRFNCIAVIQTDSFYMHSFKIL